MVDTHNPTGRQTFAPRTSRIADFGGSSPWSLRSRVETRTSNRTVFLKDVAPSRQPTVLLCSTVVLPTSWPPALLLLIIRPITTTVSQPASTVRAEAGFFFRRWQWQRAHPL